MHTQTISKEILYQHYQSGKSMFEIALKLNCSPHKIVYWMNKYEIKKRTRSEAMYTKLNPNGDPFKIKNNLTQKETFLYGLGIGIYWGEGEKASNNAVRVTNTDPYVLILFKRFLLDICQLEKRKIKYSIVCFNDSNPEEANTYWAKILKTSKEKFGKIVQIPKQGKGTYKRKSHYGVCTLTVSNIKLKRWIMQEIKKIKQYADIV